VFHWFVNKRLFQLRFYFSSTKIQLFYYIRANSMFFKEFLGFYDEKGTKMALETIWYILIREFGLSLMQSICGYQWFHYPAFLIAYDIELEPEEPSYRALSLKAILPGRQSFVFVKEFSAPIPTSLHFSTKSINPSPNVIIDWKTSAFRWGNGEGVVRGGEGLILTKWEWGRKHSLINYNIQVSDVWICSNESPQRSGEQSAQGRSALCDASCLKRSAQRDAPHLENALSDNQ
jgi:hypothetical protein